MTPVVHARTALGSLLLAVVLVAAVPPGAAGGDAAEERLGLPDGPAWAHARLDLTGTSCLAYRLAGVVRDVGDGEAILVDVPGIGHVGAYFPPTGAVSVRASATVTDVRIAVSEAVQVGARERTYDAEFVACDPGRAAGYAGSFDVWTLHSAGVRADATSLRATEGALDLTRAADGVRVGLWGLASFTRGSGAEAAAPAPAGLAAPGASASVESEKRVPTDGRAFGAFAQFDLVEEYELHGPAGAHAWKRLTGSGGSVDPGSFHGPAGEWLVKVQTSAGRASASQAYFVLADLSG